MRTGKSTLVVLGALSLAACVSAGWLLISLSPRTSEARAIALLSPTQQAPSPSEQVRLALYSAGLTPEALAAAGVTGAEQVSAVVAAVKAQFVNNPTALTTAHQAVGLARQAVADLEKAVQSGTGSAESVTSLGQARSSLSTATASRDNLVNGLFTTGTNSLSPAQRATLSTIRENAKWTCPIEFLCVNRSESDWVALTAALAHERIASKRGTPVDAAVQSALTEARGVPAVATAASNLATHLPSVRQAWETAATVSG